MTNRSRDILTVLLVVFMAVAAFVAGYLANDLRQGRLFGSDAQAADNFDLFWEAWSWVEHSYIGQMPEARNITYGAIRGSLAVLGDPYTIFVEPPAREAERESLRGNFGGIGATVGRDEEGNLVLTPIAGNPAEAAGILVGDILLAVDGRQVGPDMAVAAVVEIIRGEQGTPVVLTVLHPGSDEPVDITIIRSTILLPSVSYRLLEEDPTIGYIQLTRFSNESAGEVQQAIVDLQEQGAEKLILDMRHNGGGLLDAAVSVSDLFLSAGPILYQVTRSDEKEFLATDETPAGGMPLVVLVDEATASAAEIVAGALQDRERAILIGRTTFGKGAVQLVYDLSDGSSVHVTSARWLTPDRHQIDQQGLTPEIVVEATEDALAAGRDEILESAIDYFSE
jgi:carboxyl-terminal processing protease